MHDAAGALSAKSDRSAESRETVACRACAVAQQLRVDRYLSRASDASARKLVAIAAPTVTPRSYLCT